MIFVIKLNDNRYGLSSKNIDEYKNTILLHNYFDYNNIHITDFDYVPTFGIEESDWFDDLHWTDDFYIKWTIWIVNKIKQLLEHNNIITNENNKILIISDSTIDYNIEYSLINRKSTFYNELIKNNIHNNILAKGGGCFSNKNRYINFSNMIYREKIKNNKYLAIIVIGGINDTFINNSKSIINGINKFSNISNDIIIK